MFQPIRDQEGHLLSHQPRITNFVEDVEILLPIKFRFQRRSGKFFSQSETRASILFFRSVRKTQTWLKSLRSCSLSSFVKFRSAVSEEKSRMSEWINGRYGHLVFPIGLKNKTWYRTLRSYFLSRFVEFPSAVSEEKWKMSQPIRGQGGHLVFAIGPKNKNLVQDI